MVEKILKTSAVGFTEMFVHHLNDRLGIDWEVERRLFESWANEKLPATSMLDSMRRDPVSGVYLNHEIASAWMGWRGRVVTGYAKSA